MFKDNMSLGNYLKQNKLSKQFQRINQYSYFTCYFKLSKAISMNRRHVPSKQMR